MHRLLGRVFGLLRTGAKVVGGCGGALLLALVAFQRKLYYVPSLPGAPRAEYPATPDRFGLGFEEVWLTTSDGVKLHAWLCFPPSGKLRAPTIVFLQENAGNIAHRLQNVQTMVSRLGVNVFIVSYRGYGRSDGAPCEAGLVLDCHAAVDHLAGRRDVDPKRLVLFGRSLGGAVAAAAAAERPAAVRCVILENTFTSIPAMAGQLLPLLGALVGPGAPLERCIFDPWRTLGRMPAIVAPVMFVVSGRDEMVPPAQMRALWDARRSPRCVWLPLPQATHMDAWAVGGDAYWGGMRAFLAANAG